jgi:hypothetical protein
MCCQTIVIGVHDEELDLALRQIFLGIEWGIVTEFVHV